MRVALLGGKPWRTVALVAAVALLSACGSKDKGSEGGGKVVAEQLRKSFDKAEEPIKQQTAEAVAALLAKDYVRAVGNMSQVVRKQRTLDPVQRKVLEDLVIYARKAAERDPQVNTPQLYKANMDLQLLLYPLD